LQFLTHSACVGDHDTLQILLLPTDKCLVEWDRVRGHTFIEMTGSSIARNIVSSNWTEQLHTLPVLHFNRCLTAEYSGTTAHCNGNFDSDNKIYVT
jgi:hypothetical protein